jgi:hypothetical protein
MWNRPDDLGRDIGQHRRLEEAAALGARLPPVDDLGALLDGVGDVGLDLLERLHVDQRPDHRTRLEAAVLGFPTAGQACYLKNTRAVVILPENDIQPTPGARPLRAGDPMSDGSAHEETGAFTPTAARFTGRWRNLFYAFSPPLLALRPVTPASIDLELQEPSIREYYKTRLRDERALVCRDMQRLAIEPLDKIDYSQVAVRPEREAIRIAYALLLAGHSPGFLGSWVGYWEDRLSNADPSGHTRDASCGTIGEPTQIFSLSDWKTRNYRRTFTCYFVATYLRNFPQGLDPRVNHWSLSGSKLPEDIQAALQDVCGGYRPEDQGLFVEVKALDANDAIEQSLAILEQLTQTVEIVLKKDRARTLDLRRDLRTELLFEAEGSAPIRLTYRPLHLRHRRLEVRDRDTSPKVRALMRNSDSFSAIFRAYAHALAIVKTEGNRQSLAPPRNAFRIFLHLTTELDSIFADVCAFFYPKEEYRSYLLPSIGARIMALDSLRQVCSAMYIALASDKNRGKDLRSLMIGDPRRIGNRFELHIGCDRKLSYLTRMAYFLQYHWRTGVGEFLRKAATRYYFDLLRCVMHRNSLVHENEEAINYYLVRVLLDLYRLVISFRISLCEPKKITR